jgi:hypothetical protein
MRLLGLLGIVFTSFDSLASWRSDQKRARSADGFLWRAL